MNCTKIVVFRRYREGCTKNLFGVNEVPCQWKPWVRVSASAQCNFYSNISVKNYLNYILLKVIYCNVSFKLIAILSKQILVTCIKKHLYTYTYWRSAVYCDFSFYFRMSSNRYYSCDKCSSWPKLRDRRPLVWPIIRTSENPVILYRTLKKTLTKEASSVTNKESVALETYLHFTYILLLKWVEIYSTRKQGTQKLKWRV